MSEIEGRIGMNIDSFEKLCRDKNFQYYRVENILLCLADCRDVMKYIPDNSVNCIITDPPYDIGYSKYDNDIFFKVEPELFRILCVGSPMVFWYTIKKINMLSNIKLFNYVWMIIAVFQGTVSKSVIGNRCYAPILVYSKGKFTAKIRHFTDVIYTSELPCIKSRIRAGDFKPTYVQAQLLAMFSNPNILTLDPFCGFSSLLLAGLWFGYSIVGIESDPIRYKVSCEILKNRSINKSIPEMIDDIERGNSSCTLL